MYRRPSKRTELIQRIAVYSAMTAAVLIIVTGLVLILLGYRFDSDNGRVEQGGLLQFASIPSGGTIEIDGKALSAKTPTKSSVIAGMHGFLVWKDKYEHWNKTLDIKAGTLTWLNYIRFVPVDRPVQPVKAYHSLAASLEAPDGKSILLQPDAAVASFDLIDIRSDAIKSTILTIPVTAYSESTTANVAHGFAIDSWDTGGRFVLVKHTYADKSEWLVVDTHDVSATKNITSLLDIDVSHVVFSGTSGNILYALSGGDIRKLDLSAATISRSLVSQVTSFELYETNIITYVGSVTNTTNRVVGLYREGDTAPRILRTVTGDGTAPLHVATAHYYNQDYVAISLGTKVDITSGTYPDSDADTESLRAFANFELTSPVQNLSFSPAGFYVLAQAGTVFQSYDIEHTRLNKSVVTADTAAVVAPLQWLDDNHLWSDLNGSLTMREFDGANTTVMNTAAVGHAVTLTENDRYFYSVGKTDTGYQLQRIRMILQ